MATCQLARDIEYKRNRSVEERGIGSQWIIIQVKPSTPEVSKSLQAGRNRLGIDWMFLPCSYSLCLSICCQKQDPALDRPLFCYPVFRITVFTFLCYVHSLAVSGQLKLPKQFSCWCFLQQCITWMCLDGEGSNRLWCNGSLYNWLLH